MENFYNTKEVKKHATKYHNPNVGKTHHIRLPFRMIIAGNSGSMKTNTLINLIKSFNDTFDHIVLCCKSSHEPLYKFLIDKLEDNISVFEDGKIPDLESLNSIGGQILTIFDDLVNDKKANEIIADYFIRSRKIASGVSCVYITQSYYSVPKKIRSNSNYIILKKLSSTKDLGLILSEYNLANIDIKRFKYIYKVCTEKKENSLLIDIDEGKIYFNFTKDITPKEEGVNI